MKFECNVCVESCLLDMGDSSVIPEDCPIGFESAEWHEVPEPAALPKLNAEDPDENRFTLDGVEYEAVEYGEGACNYCVFTPGLCFTIARPKCFAGSTRNDRKVYFRRVNKDEKSQLPDWLKLGAWAAVGKFVGKIDWINRDASECRITCGESRFAKRDEVKPVTWREWTFEEAPEAVKCTVSGILRIARLTLLANQGKPIHGYELPGVTCFASFDWMLNNATQLNSLPCGVPQVDGKDLEG